MNKTLICILLTCSLMYLPAPGLADSPEQEFSTEGLELVEKDKRGSIYADPGIDWSEYSQVIIDNSTVAFRKNWQRDQNRKQRFKVQDKDVIRMKSEMSTLFDQVFADEMVANGTFELGTQSGANVMRITPHIVDLDVYSPDTKSAQREAMYGEQAGKMTLKLEIYDSVTGDLIAKVSDRQEAHRYITPQRMSGVQNRAEAEKMIKKWAKGLRERLADAQSASGNSK